MYKKLNINNLSLNIKISFIVIMLITFLIMLSGITLYFVFNGILRKQIMNDLDHVMTQNTWNMETFVNSVNQATLYLCTDRSVATVLNTDYSQNLLGLSADLSKLRTEYSNHIAIPLNDVLSDYKSYFFVNKELPLAEKLDPFSFDLSESGLYRSTDISDEDWYNKACDYKGSYYTFVLGDNKNKLYMARSVSSPYLVGSNSKNGFMGIEVFGFNISQIGKKIEVGQLTASTMVFLTNSDGTILYSKNQKDLQTSISQYMPLRLMENLASNETVSLSYKGEHYIASINVLKYGWYLIALIPNGDISKRLESVNDIILLTCFLALALGVLFSIVFSKSITQPIKRLAFTMKSVKSKEYFDISVQPPSGDEVGVLYESFNNMMKRINALMDEVLRSAKLNREAEIKALQAQINPHFLYNTLDAVNWLALCDGNDKIAAMTTSIANIMRFNIKDPEKLVTVQEEIENVKNYVSIQMLRYRNSFDVEYCIDPETLPQKAPKLTLQPLVENAIIHGIQGSDRKGCIAVSGFKENSGITLYIKDNGIGADANELNNYLGGGDIHMKKTDSYGIRNVNQRIKLYFGEKYGLSYESNDSGGITAVVMLPFSDPAV